MRKSYQTALAILTLLSVVTCLPAGFVYLSEYDPTILQEIRYHSYHNFVGRPITGYNASECILTEQAARNLSLAQSYFVSLGYSIKVYDCYRPQKAVDDFYAWSQNLTDDSMKDEFYPRLNKSSLFSGYIAQKSNHTKGSTSDLALVKLPAGKPANYTPGQNLTSCFANSTTRFADNILDFGTGFDCLDTIANTDNKNITEEQRINRQFLKEGLSSFGFVNYVNEWWHFTLDPQPYPDQFFDFNVDPRFNDTRQRNVSNFRSFNELFDILNIAKTNASNETVHHQILNRTHFTNEIFPNGTIFNSTHFNFTQRNSSENGTSTYPFMNATHLSNSTFPNSTFFNSTGFNFTQRNSSENGTSTYPFMNATHLSNSTFSNGTIFNSTHFNFTQRNSSENGTSTYPFMNATHLSNSTFSNGTIFNSTGFNFTQRNSSENGTSTYPFMNATQLSNSTFPNSTIFNSTHSNFTDVSQGNASNFHNLKSFRFGNLTKNNMTSKDNIFSPSFMNTTHIDNGTYTNNRTFTQQTPSRKFLSADYIISSE